MILDIQTISDFQHIVLQKGKELYRDMPWRSNTDPYYILLSEIMLQQTQVLRVIEKFYEFTDAYPTIQDLALAPFENVLSHWTGLGYNRRARFLHQAAQAIVNKYNGVLPNDYDSLLSFSGIGPNTAASILTYAYNAQNVFIETNVRTVFIYTFFSETDEKIDEKVLIQLGEQTLYKENPRIWYWALMDYGAFIKKTIGNFNKRAKNYTTQSKFEGSNRQKRSQILRLILQEGKISLEQILQETGFENELCVELIKALLKDSLICENEGGYSIGKT